MALEALINLPLLAHRIAANRAFRPYRALRDRLKAKHLTKATQRRVQEGSQILVRCEVSAYYKSRCSHFIIKIMLLLKDRAKSSGNKPVIRNFPTSQARTGSRMIFFIETWTLLGDKNPKKARPLRVVALGRCKT